MYQDAVELLLTSDLLIGVPKDVLQTLDPPPEMITVPSGETLISQGEAGAAFFLLVHGRLRVFVEDENGKSRRVGEVLPGEGVGEMSLLTDDLTSATVRAMHDSYLVRFSRESYIQLMESSSEAALQITRTVIKRLREGISGKGRKMDFSTIAILPVDPNIEIEDFSNLLSTQLEQITTVRTLSPKFLDPQQTHLVRQRARMSPEDDHAISNSLMEQEQHEGVVLYQADYELTEWTRICIRQADIVLIVSSVNSPSELSEAEETLINGLDPDLSPRTDLILLHPEDWHPHCGAAKWIEPRLAHEFHHLRSSNNADFARLSRILTGNAFNLVLGGGGARGFAQIGVLRALTEAGVPVDRIGGTSMGSIIGSLFAMGLDFDQITQKSREIWITGKPLSDYTFPAISLVRGRRLHNLVKNALANWQVEDLPITFYCVSGNLTDIDLMLHDRGPLWEGVRASGSIPGAGPPMFLNGKLLVDGGVLNNLPGDIMQNRHGGYVIIVDVSPQEPISVPDDIGETLSGWRILWSRINPFETAMKVPNLFEVLYRTATLSSERMSKITHKLADLLIVPPLARFGTLSFDEIDEIIAVGYRDTVRRLYTLEDPLIKRYLNLDNLPPLEDVAEPEPSDSVNTNQSRSKIKSLAFAATIIIGAVGGGWAYLNGHVGSPSPSSPPQSSAQKSALSKPALPLVAQQNGVNILPVPIITAKLQADYEVQENYAGRVSARRSSKLGFDRPGMLIEILVDEGSYVKSGELLARLDDASLMAKRVELKAQLAHRQAVLRQIQARMKLAKLTTKRSKHLLSTKNISQQRYDESFFTELALKSEIIASAANITQARAALDSLDLDIYKSKILAPFDGQVVERYADEGVATNSGMPILQLIENSVMEMRAGIPQVALPNLTVGQSYGIKIEDKIFKGRLKVLLGTIDLQTRTIPAIFELSDPDRELRTGQLAQLKLKNTVTSSGFWLPTTAIIGGRRGLWNAFVAKPSNQGNGLMKLSRHELLIVYSESDRVFVRGTLQDGDQVVASGLHRLVPGQLVTLKP